MSESTATSAWNMERATAGSLFELSEMCSSVQCNFRKQAVVKLNWLSSERVMQ
jgi:hypothetical protein